MEFNSIYEGPLELELLYLINSVVDNREFEIEAKIQSR